MQDRLVKATHSSEARVNVQRVQVAAQAVQSSLRLASLLFHNLVGRTRRRLVGCRSVATVTACLLAAKATRATDERRHLVLKHRLARGLVHRCGERRHSSSLALVKHLNDTRLIHQDT